jgi:hypothetical protein
MRLFVLLFIAAAILPAQTCPGLQSQPEYKIPAEPERDAWQQPQQVISSLHFSTTETVAVIETGFPYFAQRIAPLVKKVYAVNSDARSFQGRGALPPSITTIVSTASDPKISGLNIDTVIIIDTLHLVPQQALYYLKLIAGLKAGGRLVVIDRILPSSIPQQLKDTDIETQLPSLGFTLGQKYTYLPVQYFLVFNF